MIRVSLDSVNVFCVEAGSALNFIVSIPHTSYICDQ